MIVGPTASGKTELAVALARELGGEVLSADSRQVYRALDAGTAKPQRDADGRVEGVPYHLLDLADASEAFDAGRFAKLARPLLEEIRRRGRIPIVAGGTGLYLRALLEGLSEMPGRDQSLRERLQREAGERGRAWLHQRLCQVDPEAAEKIPANNIQRVIRALEVYELSGRPMSTFWKKGERQGLMAPERPVILSIHWPPEELKNRIIARARVLWPKILGEVRELIGSGYAGSEPGFQSLGYREALLCLRGALSEEEGLQKLIRTTLAYAKRQRTWLRHQIEAVEIKGGTREAMLQEALAAIAESHETSPI